MKQSLERDITSPWYVIINKSINHYFVVRPRGDHCTACQLSMPLV